MKKCGRYGVLTIALGTLACSGKDKTGEGAGTATEQQRGADGQSLILAANQQGAFLPAELSDAKYADESTLPLKPFQLPPTDFSTAGTETEPNNTAATATAIGPSLAVRGALSAGDVDYFVFETTGEPQLWAIEAVGKSVRALMFVAPGSYTRTEGQHIDSTTLVIPNLYLSAGKHSISLLPSTIPGAYTLRAVPLGKPDLRMEREPNDEEAFAETLRAGIPRVGFILERGDRDVYSFALREAGHVKFDVTSPPDISLMVTVFRNIGPSYSFSAGSKGESVHMDVMLPPGDYQAVVGSNDKGSLTPYKLRFDFLDPFARSVDQEPNNDFAEAAPLPSNLVLKGSVGEYGDKDFYRLPTVPSETSMRVQVLQMSGSMTRLGSIQVINRSGDRDQFLSFATSDSILEVKLPPNAPLFIQLTHRGDYELKLSFTPGIPTPAGKAPFTASLPPGPHLIEAFSTSAQRLSLPVTVDNPGTQPIQVAIDAVTSHSVWSVTPARQTVTVEPGKKLQVPLQLILPPDEGARDAVQVAVRASSSGGSTSATTNIYALCAATPANPQAYSPLPSQMLGGLNLAATSLGGRPVTSAIRVATEKLLYDGLTPSDASWTGDRTAADPELMLTVALAGDRAATLSGITLVPGIGNPDVQVDQFDVLASEDGQTFRPVMSGRLRLAAVEQAFAFPQPVRARFARLHLRSNQPGKPNSRSALAEWKVIGAPGENPFNTATFNLADPRLGGHVVWSRPLLAWPSDAILNDSTHAQAMKLDASRPNEWVVGFRHNRAAQISRLEWVQPAAERNTKLLSKVEISVSTESPSGPWTPLGSWKITPTPGSSTPLDLAEPEWARFVRFSTTEPRKAGEYWKQAESIRIYERGMDASYRSMLGEWGHYARPAIYERMVAPAAGTIVEEVTGNGKRDDAKKLESEKTYRGRVIVGEDEDWYRIAVPGDHNTLTVKLQGDPMLRAVATLQDESGKILPTKIAPGPGGITQVDASVEGGKTYFLRLVEPPRSIALVWDNSPSIRNYWPQMYRALMRIVEAVQPGREFVNLLPFRDNPQEKFLLPSWSDQPSVLRAGIQNYNRADASSDAEFSVLTATEELGKRDGSKAIFLLTDALSPGYPRTAEVWAAFGRVPVRVFSVEMQLGNLAEPQQHMMQDLADANAGHYSTFRSNDALDVAFDRASCYLRRPAHYTLNAATRFEVPAPVTSIESLLAKSGHADVYGIYFDVGSAILKPESGPVLKEISDALVKNPTWKLSVEGHTDNAGDDASNMTLSRNRAASVKRALASRFGIAAERLETNGFGASKPKESNGTAKGRALNRRVELVRK